MTNSSYFKSQRPDGRSVWQVIFDVIEPRIVSKELEVGAILSHTELRGLLEEKERPGYYSVIRRVSKELQKKYARALQPARGAGYRLVGGTSQIEFGQAYRKRGERSIKTGLGVMRTADRSLMSQADRTWADKVQGGMVALANIAAMHEEKLMEHHSAIEELKKTQVRDKRDTTATAEELAELRRRVEELARARDRERDK